MSDPIAMTAATIKNIQIITSITDTESAPMTGDVTTVTTNTAAISMTTTATGTHGHSGIDMPKHTRKSPGMDIITAKMPI